MPLLCASGALTLLGILKSRQPISSCSHHLKGNECHFIETVSHSLHWSNNLSDVYVLSGAPSFSLPHVEDALHWPFITPHAKIHLMFKHIPDYNFSGMILFYVSRFHESQLTRCFFFAESALNPPIKAPALLWNPSSHQPVCDHQSLFSPVRCT